MLHLIKFEESNRREDMAVPDFQSFFLPLLKFNSDGTTYSTQEAYVAMAGHFFKMSDDDLKEMLLSGKQQLWKNVDF